MRPYLPLFCLAFVMMLVGAGTTAALAKLMEPVLDDIFVAKDAAMLPLIAGTVLVVFALKSGATFGQSMLMTVIGYRIVRDMQKNLFQHLLHADMSYLSQQTSGALASRFIYDVGVLRYTTANTITSFGKDIFTLFFLVALMFYQDSKLAFIAFFVFPLAVYPIVRFGKRIRKIANTTQEDTGQLNSFLSQIFQGMRHVRAYSRENYEIGRAASLMQRLYTLSVKAARIRAGAPAVMETLGGLAIVVVILYGGMQVIEGEKTTGNFFSFITALLLAYDPLKRLSRVNTHLQEGVAAASRLFSIMDTKPAITDTPYAKPLRFEHGAIQLNNVDFAYKADAPVLQNVSFSIAAGQTVALVGASGAGKSTIMNLLLRFYEPTNGQLTIDGQDIKDVTLTSLRQHIGYVGQEVLLFDDTIEANIRYGKLDASQDELEQAAIMAFADDFIKELPAGYATMVGEHGAQLSGGQRQRVAIARAMLKNAPILLLDEATSALDNESEHYVQQALRALMQGRTTLVIAHRLSTIKHADKIIVMDKGHVIEEGSHASLYAMNGHYRKLYDLQFASLAESNLSDNNDNAKNKREGVE